MLRYLRLCTFIPAVLLGSWTCGTADEGRQTGSDAGHQDAHFGADGPGSVDGSVSTPAAADAGQFDRWAEVRQALDDEINLGGLAGFAFTVRSGADTLAFEHEGGRYRLDQPLPTDSSIKTMTGLLIMTLIRDGVFGLSDNMAQRLGWVGPEGAITIEQLMSFTSGLSGRATCLSAPPTLAPNGQLIEPSDAISLADCAEAIRVGGLLATPGTTFTYGGAHQAVLARIAESSHVGAGGERWDELFALRILSPLGLSSNELRYVNNRVAASAVATSAAASRVYEALAMDLEILPRRVDTPRLLPVDLAETFVTDRTAEPVDRRESPWRSLPQTDLHFGLGIWLDCPDYATAPAECLYVGSGGNGSTAWIDVSGRYAAALTLYQDSLTGYQDGYRAMKRLVPLIRSALGREPAGPACLPPGDHARSLTLDGVQHDYVIHVPPNRGSAAALVLQLHGGGSTAAAMNAVSGLSALADREGFVVVSPEGWMASGVGPAVWNAGACCGPVERAPDHVAALEAIIDATVGEDSCIDPGQIFATGHSNGGMMTYRLACALSDKLAAVAVSGGALMNMDLSRNPPAEIFQCSLNRPVSLLHVHGLEDLCAPYLGGPTGGGILMPAVETVVADWRQRIGCGVPIESVDGPVRRHVAECLDGSSVELVTVAGLGHAWAGSPIYGNPQRCGGTTTMAISTSEELWRFFRDHRR